MSVFFLHAVVSMLAIMNPIGNLPIFISLVEGETPAYQIATARRSTLTAFGFLTLFALLGNNILLFFGITLAAFRVAGSIILFGIGLKILQGRNIHSSHNLSSAISAINEDILAKDDVAITPLATPILAGPGSITTVMLLVGAEWQIQTLLLTIAAVAIVALGTYLIFRYSTLVTRYLGPLEMNIISRVMGLLLAVIAVQMGASGLLELFPGLGR
ncbi:MarC family protein [Moorella naiadis]|uniref:MarC family protein n=1 Tax=Moorella naiadis (nom. illeg.) TaxID=3093670 RepID=UPI003D9CBBD9